MAADDLAVGDLRAHHAFLFHVDQCQPDTAFHDSPRAGVVRKAPGDHLDNIGGRPPLDVEIHFVGKKLDG